MGIGHCPINVDRLDFYLESYPNREDAVLLSNGFRNGFKIDFVGPRRAQEFRNLKSAYEHTDQLRDKINKELLLGRLAGPFDYPPLPNLHVSPVGIVPKNDGGWRMITHLSYPDGGSINDGIDPGLCSVTYTTFDKVAKMIYELGQSAYLAKRDLKSAYRILPIHPDDFSLLGIKVEGKYYIDKFLPMGLSQSAYLFEKVSTFLHWLTARKAGVETLDHMLDDFIFAGKRDSDSCWKLVMAFEEVCAELGVPIAVEKSVNPTTTMVFLGLEIDTTEMSIRIPSHRVDELTSLLINLMLKSKINLRELQRLIGKLCFFSKAIRSSRAFLRRFYDVSSGLKKPHHKIRVTRDLKSDASVWLSFLDGFNGVSYIPEAVWVSNVDLELFTDSAGSFELGAACFLKGQWCFYSWPREWEGTPIMRDMTFLEMVPVVLAIFLWGQSLANKNVTLRIDNQSLVTVLNKQTSKSKRLMHLVRQFVLKSMEYNTHYRAVHISSANNTIADSISRRQWSRFRQLAPTAKEGPEVVPKAFRAMISAKNLIDC